MILYKYTEGNVKILKVNKNSWYTRNLERVYFIYHLEYTNCKLGVKLVLVKSMFLTNRIKKKTLQIKSVFCFEFKQNFITLSNKSRADAPRTILAQIGFSRRGEDKAIGVTTGFAIWWCATCQTIGFEY